MVDRLKHKIKRFQHFELRNLHLYSNTQNVQNYGEDWNEK